MVLCTCGLMFSGCGNSIDNLSIKLTSGSLVESETQGEYELTLVKTQDDNNKEWSVQIAAEVEGLGAGMSSKIEWSGDSRYVNIVANEDGSIATITGVTSTNIPTIVTAYSVENRKAQAIIKVTNIVKPQSISGSKYGAGELGIPLGTAFSLKPEEVFTFLPEDATVPVYEYTINGVVVNSDEEFTLSGVEDGYATLTAAPKNKDEFTQEQLTALSYTIDRVRVYNPLTDENTTLSIMGQAGDVDEITLIKNAKDDKNKAILNVTAPSSVEYSVSSPNNVVYDERDNPRGQLSVKYDTRLKQFTLVGLAAMDEFMQVDINLTVAGIKNSMVLTKSFSVRIVDYPNAIAVNGVAGNTDVELRVFDQYKAGEVGTELRLNIAPDSKLYTDITVELDDEAVVDMDLVGRLLINNQPFTGTMSVKSGTTMYLTNNKGYGQLTLKVYAADTRGTVDEVVRKIIIKLEQSITSMEIDRANFDATTGNLILEIDEYNDSVSTSYRDLFVRVSPENASFDTVTAVSSDTSVVEISIEDYVNCEILVRAKNIGTATLSLVAQSGVKLTVQVQVVSRYKATAVKLDPNMSSVMYCSDLTTYKLMTISNDRDPVETLEMAYIAKTGSGNGVYLVNTFYPSSAVESGMVASVEFTSGDLSIASLYNTNSSIYRNVLTTERAGLVTFDMVVRYYKLVGSNLVLEEDVVNAAFTIQVFEQITSLTVNESSVELLAAVQNLGAGISIGGSTSQSAYDSVNSSKTLRVTVNPTNSNVSAANAVWSIEGNTSKITLSTTKGGETVVSVKPLAGNDLRVSATIIVSVTDLNGVAFTQEVKVIANKIQQITEVYIKNYESSLKNNSLYFELFKDDGFTLDVTVGPASATNKNLEYIIFDADLLSKREDGENVIRMSAGNGKFLYFRIKPRDPTSDDYSTQYSCKTAQLVYDESAGTYTIKPKKAGYAFAFIIPQDVAKVKVDEITNLTDQLRNVSDRATIKRLPITVADGESVYYQLYTPEDVASIGSTEAGLSKNYYVMNTIDMSPYINKQLSANSNWTWTPIGDVSSPFTGSIQSMIYNGESPTQNIVGWSLSREFNSIAAGSTVDYRNYGIFGVVTGEIKNINIYLNTYAMKQSIFVGSGLVQILNHYNYGLLVGRLSSREVKIDDENTEIQYGKISDVTVYCGNLTYVYTHKPTDPNTGVSANFGVIGMTDAGTIVNGVNATIANASITSNDMIVNFGGIVGRNLGVIGTTDEVNTYSNSSDVVANLQVTYDTKKTSQSTLGSAVGLNLGVVGNVKSDGKLSATTKLVVIGGVVGKNTLFVDLGVEQDSAVINNVLSSVKIRSESVDAIQGGVVGYSIGGEIAIAYYDIYDTQASLTGDNDSIGIRATGFTGGIAGQIINTAISYAIVQSYDLDPNTYNMISTGGSMGGLVGFAQGGSIRNSFVNAGLRGNGGIIAGILGQASYTGDGSVRTEISDVYARGYLTVNNASGYAIAGVTANSVNIARAYVDLNNDDLTAANGALSVENVYIVRSTATDTSGAITIINRDEMLDKVVLELGFGVDAWAKDSGETPTNAGFPYLLMNGEKFVRQVPNQVILTARTFDNVLDDGRINSVLNIAGDTKKIVIMYREDAVYNLSELFGLTTDLSLAPENISINFSVNGTNVVQLLSTVNFVSTQIKLIGTGTAYIRINSSQNLRAYDAIQICVIDGYDSVGMFDENGDSIIEDLGEGVYQRLKIKHNGSTQAFVEYYSDGQKVSGISGGVKFVTGLKYYANSGSLITATDSNGAVITNYNISIMSWQEGEFDGNACLYYYASNNDKIVLTAVGDDKDSAFVTLIIPYIDVQFYMLDSDKNIVSLNSYKYEIVELNEMSFDTQIYYGVSDIAMGVGDGTTIFSGEKLESSVTIFNDAYVDTMQLRDLLWYQLYEVDEDGNTAMVAYYDPTLPAAQQVLTSSDIYVNFTKITYLAESNAVIINYNAELSQTMRKNLTSSKIYRIVIGAIDDNGEKITKTVSLQWTFIPQEVTHVTISHFSDAINSGAKLTQAGDTPTNTVVAGEYGLLRITISPDYANFDSVEVTSSVVNGSPMVFDQRVLEITTDRTTGADVYTYTTWQQGVGNITNGLSLSRASLINGDFDGNFYVRTICLSTLETGTQFTITVAITANGERKTYARTLTVYKTDTLSLEGEHYSDVLGNYIVAAGTGYTSSSTWTQNQNPIEVSIGAAYYDAEISVDTASAGQGAAIIRENGKYYLYTGNVAKDNLITVTLTAKQNIGGFTYRATRSITYEVVDFYVITLRADEVMPTTKRFAFIDNKYYDFNLFDGIDSTNINQISVITFDPSNITTCNKVLNLIKSLNGIGADAYNGWKHRVVEADGRIAFVDLEPKTDPDENWIDNNYQFLSTPNGYKMVSSGISSGNVLQFELLYYYDAGSFTLTTSAANATFGLSTDYINMEFYQVTSQEHPQPIRTLNQLMSMEADIDYILLNDLTINDAWTPLNVAVKSFNGNGYSINFNATSITPSTANPTNYGLFGTIDAASVIKNVKIVIGADGLAVNDDEASKSALNFGVLAGTNNGTVYNCEVYGLNNKMAANVVVANPTVSGASHSVAGLVAVNAGGITNSRVSYVSINAGGNVAGLVVENSGVIAGSYYSGGTITNLSESADFATAGLVINNAYGGIITSSYAGGTYTVTTDGVTKLDTRESVYRTRDATIQSGVTSAGFVYTNYGTVSDCYSAVEIFSTKMSGFVFTNYGSGKISRCYSTSDLSSTGAIIASYPFIGVNSDNATQNNNYNKTDGIVNCYYYDSGFASTRLEEAKALSEADFCGTNGNSPFAEYIFSRDGEAGSEFTGVWVFVDEDNLYFTPDRFVSTLQVKADASIDKLYTNFGPKLVSASLIATPRMELVKSEENSTGEIVHTYTNKYGSVFRQEDNADYFTDYSYDPIVVSNMTQFNNAFDVASDNVEKVDDVILSDIRIVNHLTQSDLNSGVAMYSPTAKYAGILAGNGFTFNNVSLAVNNSTVEYYGLIGKLCYMPSSSDDSVSHIGTIKNYSVTLSNIACSTVTYVGGLAGWVESANLYDVKVTNNYGRVVGNNIVGGIAGYVTGTSRVHTAYSNVGVTANYRANTENLYNLDLIKAHNLDVSKKVNVDTLGYAGGLFGVIDLTQFDTSNPSSSNTNEARVYNIRNDSNASIVGKVAGGLIGGVGEYTVVYKANKTVEAGALIKGYVFAGGIVGQNNGFIKYANITYTSEVQTLVDSARTGYKTEAYLDLFSASSNPLAIGGVVGLNIGSTNINWPGGTVQLSSSKVAVRDSTAGNAGGVVGAAYGGDIRACLATGSVLASKTAYVGGIVGYLSDFSADNAILVGMNNPFGEAMSAGTTVDYVVAMNNYLAEDYNYYYALHTNDSKGIYGAVGGIVGYVSDSSLIYTTHSVATNSSDPYAYLTNPTNYFVSQISNRVLALTQTAPITSGTGYFNLYEVDDQGAVIVNYAVGKYGTDNSINLGIGKTRAYMLQNYDEIFAGWDKYSIDNSSGSPSIIEKDLPAIIEVSTIDDLKIMYWHPEKTYVLVNDIDFQDYSVTDQKRILSPFFAIGSESSPFTGEFRGKTKSDGTLPVIKDVYIINAGASSLGFFGAISNAKISNIVIENIHYSTALNKNAKANVGGLAGVATNSVVENVTILNTDTQNSGIYTNANNVGGMFGKIRSLNDGEMIIESCYVENNLVLTDNIYSAAQQTGAFTVTLGGFAGTIEGKTTIAGAMAVGQMTVKYSDMTSQAMKDQNASEIEHIVGGFAGQISGDDVVESGCVTAVNITLDNVLSHTRAGGFAGVIGGTKLTKVDSHANINVNMANITDTKVMYVGGLIGEMRSASSVSGFIAAGDIRLNGNYGVNTLNTQAANHYVAGMVAHMGSSARVMSGYSIVSVINDTMLTNIDMGFGSGDISGVSTTGSVKADKFYALTATDRANIGQKSGVVKSGGDLDTAGNVFVRYQNENDYYRIRNDATKNEMFNTTYNKMYTFGSGFYKTAPIMISQNDNYTSRFDSIDGSEYRYYLQTGNITLTEQNKLYGTNTQLSSFRGSYNGGGFTITLPAHFDINSVSVSTANCGLFGEIVSTQSEPSMILGVVIDDVMVYANLGESVENFGILAGVASPHTIFANCYVAGEINLNVRGTTSIGGLVGSSGAVYIGCATDLVANLYGDAEFKYGAIFGTANASNANYTLIDVYSAGKINNNGSLGAVAGMIADSSASNLFARNSYTMTEINSVSNKTANVVYSLGAMSHNTDGIWYDGNNAINKSSDVLWETYNYRDKRGQNFVGSNYAVDSTVNYGMPTLKWLREDNLVAYTGRGVTADPYIISTATQFAWMTENASFGTCYVLGDDIDYKLLAATSGYTTRDFRGSLDGNYNYINNLTATLFGTVSGSVTKLGFDKVATATGVILANNVTVQNAVSQIYVNSNSGMMVRSGYISDSLSTGATFGSGATNCYAGAIDNTTYSTLDSSVWVFDGAKYTLSGFLKDCATSAKPIGNFAVGNLGYDNVRTISVSSDQDFYNAMFYAGNFSGKYRIVAGSGYSTLNLNGYKLNVPSTVTEITGITTIQNGNLSNASIEKFDTNTLTIDSCGIVGDGQSAILGESSSKFSKVVIKNSRLIANRAGGMLLDTIDSAIDLTLNDSAIFVEADNVDLVAGNATEAANGYKITIRNVEIYGKPMRDIVYDNRADGSIYVDAILGGKMMNNIINNNTANVTLDLKNMGLNGSVVAKNGGNVTLTSSGLDSDGAMFGENTKNISLVLSETDKLTKAVADTNSGEITITGSNSIIESKIVTTNKAGGKITVTLTDSVIKSPLVESNAGELEITLNGTKGSEISANLVNSNTGKITANLTNTKLNGSIATTNAASGKIDFVMSGGSNGAPAVDNNAGSVNVELENATINSNLFNTNTGTINWNKLSGNTIKNYLIDTQNSTAIMIMKLDSGNTISHSLIRTANSNTTFELTSAVVTTYLVESNNKIMTITATNCSNLRNLVNVNNAGATISLTATNCTITQMISASNAGVLSVNITGGTLDRLAVTNAATGSITGSISGTNVKLLVGTNNGTVNVSVKGNATVSSVITTNGASGSATIEVSGATVSGDLVAANAGVATINLGSNIKIATTSANLVGVNTKTTTINVNSALTLTGMNSFAFVGDSSGTINLNINAATSISGDTISGVVSKYSNTNTDEKAINVVLKANYTLKGTTVSPIAGNTTGAGAFDATKNLNYTQNGFNIIVNGTNFDPNPVTPDPNPENPDSGETGGGGGA